MHMHLINLVTSWSFIYLGIHFLLQLSPNASLASVFKTEGGFLSGAACRYLIPLEYKVMWLGWLGNNEGMIIAGDAKANSIEIIKNQNENQHLENWDC